MSKPRGRCGIFRSLVALGAALALGGQAKAEPRALPVPANAGWQHAETGLVLLPRLAGYPRTSIEDNTTAELDVIVNFAAPDQSTLVTLFLFRPALMSVPVWFDRSETQILLRDEYRRAQPVAEARAFAPPGATVASALRRTYSTGSASHRTTALAIVPTGEWLVAIRISSPDPDPAALESKLDAVIAAIRWPQGVAEGVPATLVASCPKPLEFARRARLQRPNITDALFGAVLQGMVADQAEEETPSEAEPVVFCRDAPGKIEYGVYRNAADRERDSYVMALGDAGRIISLAPGLGELLSGTNGYTLSLGDLDRTLIYPSFDKLASPEKALEAVMETAPISSSARGGSEITVSTDAE